MNQVNKVVLVCSRWTTRARESSKRGTGSTMFSAWCWASSFAWWARWKCLWWGFAEAFCSGARCTRWWFRWWAYNADGEEQPDPAQQALVQLNSSVLNKFLAKNLLSETTPTAEQPKKKRRYNNASRAKATSEKQALKQSSGRRQIARNNHEPWMHLVWFVWRTKAIA